VPSVLTHLFKTSGQHTIRLRWHLYTDRARPTLKHVDEAEHAPGDCHGAEQGDEADEP
jgi:hypothetical protein